MNIEKLSFEFEGDFEHGQKIQAGISKALGEIGNLQNGAMGLPPAKPAEARVIDATPSLKSRRRRRRSEPSETEGGESGAGEGTDEVQKSASRKPTGSSPIQLLRELVASGFFKGGKTTADIVSHVNAKGHTKLISGSFTSQLQTLSKKDILERKPTENGGWIYYPGPKND